MTLKEIYCKLVDKWCYNATLEIQEPVIGAIDWKEKTDRARHNCYRLNVLMIHFAQMFPHITSDSSTMRWANDQMARVLFLKTGQWQ